MWFYVKKSRKTATAGKSQFTNTRRSPCPLATIALFSGGYWQRVWGFIIWQTEEYVKKDFAYSIVAAFFIAVLTLLDGSATITTLYWSVIGFLAVFVARIGQHTITTPA